MRIIGVTLAAMLCCSSTLADDLSEWKEYASKEGRFKVLFPEEPEVGKVPNQQPEMHRIGIKRKVVDRLGYVCYWSVEEKPFPSKEAEADYLKNFQEGAVKAGTLDGEKVITLDEIQGREFFVKISDADYMLVRAYVDGKYHYSLTVFGKDKEAVLSRDAAKFLASLAVEKPAD